MAGHEEHADVVEVERLGGLGGFGLAGSRVRSRGRLRLGTLSEADRRTVDALFGGSARGGPAPAPMPDAFRYRVTRKRAGAQETVEVAESALPDALIDCIRDELA